MKHHDILDVISNKDDTYEGNLWHYYRLGLWNSPDHGHHNGVHYGHVTCQGYDAGLFYLPTGMINRLQFRLMLIAHLMHDFGHCGNKDVPDAVNIAVALQAVTENILERDAPYVLQIQAIIRATEFPYATGVEVDLFGKIVRAADLSGGLNPQQDLMQGVYNFAREWGEYRAKVLEMQPGFHDKVVRPHVATTEWGRMRLLPLVDPTIEKFNKLLDGVKAPDHNPLAWPKYMRAEMFRNAGK